MAATPNLDEAVKLVEDATGYAPNRPVAELDGWHYGERVRVLEDDDDAGIGSGEEGWLVLMMVGAAKYQNEHVSVGIVVDGSDSALDVSLDNLEGVN